MKDKRQTVLLTIKHQDLDDAIDACVANSNKPKKTLAHDLDYSSSQFSRMMSRSDTGANFPAGRLWDLMVEADDFTPLDWMVQMRDQMNGTLREEMIDEALESFSETVENIRQIKNMLAERKH